MLQVRLMQSLLIVALLARATLLCVPSFSTDTRRFLSDGINLLEGRNPYSAAPALGIAYGHLRSFYTPLMQAVFAGAAWLLPDPLIFRLLGGGAELLFLGWFFARRRRRPVSCWLTVFFLFNPLSLNEIWREGHLDHIGVFFLYFAIVHVHAAFAHRRSNARALGFTLLAIAWKFVGVIAVLFVFRKRRSSPLLQVFSRFANSFTLFAVSFFLLQFFPVYTFTSHAERGLTVYATYWHHGNGIVHLLHALGFADAHGVYLVQRLILLALLAIAALYLARRLAYGDVLCLGIGTLLVLFPVQHPWYYFLLFPFLLLYRRWRRALALLCVLSPLSYLGYTQSFSAWGFWVVLAVWLSSVCLVKRRYAFATGG